MYDIKTQLEEIREKYDLEGFQQNNGYIFYGDLYLNHSYNSVPMQGKFFISMFVSFDFPKVLPIVIDQNNVIEKGFHKNSDNILCLACNTEMRLKISLKKHITICDFIELFVIPYFYSYAFYKEYGKVPFGERGHGSKGILEFYKEYFENIDVDQAIKLLSYFKNNDYRGHHLCPCGSGEIIRRCHKEKILYLFNNVGKEALSEDYYYLLKEYKDTLIFKKRLEREKRRREHMLKDKIIISPLIKNFPWDPKFYYTELEKFKNVMKDKLRASKKMVR